MACLTRMKSILEISWRSKYIFVTCSTDSKEETPNHHEIYEKINYYATSTPDSISRKYNRASSGKKMKKYHLPTPSIMRYSKDHTPTRLYGGKYRSNSEMRTPPKFTHPIQQLTMHGFRESSFVQVTPPKAIQTNKVLQSNLDQVTFSPTAEFFEADGRSSVDLYDGHRAEPTFHRDSIRQRTHT